MEPITDEDMRARLAASKPYTLVLLKATPKQDEPGALFSYEVHQARGFPGSTL
jgi:hypothetical protein